MGFAHHSSPVFEQYLLNLLLLLQDLDMRYNQNLDTNKRKNERMLGLKLMFFCFASMFFLITTSTSAISRIALAIEFQVSTPFKVFLLKMLFISTRLKAC